MAWRWRLSSENYGASRQQARQFAWERCSHCAQFMHFPPVIEGHVVPFPCEVAIPPRGAREVYFPPRYAGFDHTTLWPMGGQQTKLQQRLHMCIRVWDFSLGFCCPSEGEHVLDCHRSKEKEEARGEDSSLNQPQRADSGGPEKSSWSVSWRFRVVSDTQRYCGINLRSFKNQ